jgi:hypothetical protein
MALTAPPKISDQANQILSVLTRWGTTYLATVSIVSNLRDLWEQASLNTQKPRVLICFVGSEPRGGFREANYQNREDRSWMVAVTRGRGFFAERGDSLAGSSQGQTSEIPFYDIVEEVRDQIRSILSISEERPTVDYRGMKPMQLGGLVVDGISIHFSTANDIPFIGSQPFNPPQ